MASKLVHDNRNGHFACDFFHCEVMISLVKVVRLQSRQKNDPFFHRHQEHGSILLGMEKYFNMTAVIILVIPLICFDNGSL